MDQTSEPLSPLLNDDVVACILQHLLKQQGPRNQRDRVLTINRGTSYKVLPDFYAQVYITKLDALRGLFDALEERPQLQSHVRTLHIMVDPPPVFTKFYPGVDRISDFAFAGDISVDEPLIADMVENTSGSLQSLIIIGDLFTARVVDKIRTCSFQSLTELAVPMRFLLTPGSPFAQRSDAGDVTVDPAWPNLRSLWTWISVAPNLIDDHLIMDFRHLAGL
ncbi:hypothetical protein V5O48_002153 [Marasmius crinis-equi]|uniref:Uncharacterized protein n=1 Tax=Marasmius crinis-equi TaxID=585013 RepID=A0ABR3FWX7_9AGAR